MFCSKCGIENGNEANFCKSCGTAMRTDLVQFVTQMPDSSTTPPDWAAVQYANFWRRGAAAIVDWQIVGVVGAVVSRFLSTKSDGAQLIGTVVFLLLIGAWFALLESRDSATIGKRIFFLNVLRTDQSKLSFARAFGRYFGRFISAIIFGVGYFIQPFTAKKQALHDMITDSVVVQNKKGRKGLIVAAWLFQLLLLVVAVAVNIINLRGVGAQASNDNQEINSLKVESPVAENVSHSISQENCDVSENNLWYDYEPAMVSLRGKFISAKSQTPDEQEITYPALQLEGSISVHGSSDRNDEYDKAERGVALMQLVLGKEQWPAYQELKGQNVVITGTLYHGFNGNHYTNVLMTPTKIVGSQSLCVRAEGGERISGTVSLSGELKGNVSPADTLFVLARAAQGSKMPLAVIRKQVKDLPLQFTLEDSMAMTPEMKLSKFNEVVVVARVSKSGNAMLEPGDLQGMSSPIKPGTGELNVIIDSVAK